MELIANILLSVGAASAAVYCFILSRRLRKFTDLDQGVGAAVARLSVQVDQLTRALEGAKKTAGNANVQVTRQTQRAENVSRKLELMLASLHDIDEKRPPQKMERKSEFSA